MHCMHQYTIVSGQGRIRVSRCFDKVTMQYEDDIRGVGSFSLRIAQIDEESGQVGRPRVRHTDDVLVHGEVQHEKH